MITFEQAVNDERMKIRQEYLDEFLQRNPNPCVERIYYNVEDKAYKRVLEEWYSKGRLTCEEYDHTKKVIDHFFNSYLRSRTLAFVPHFSKRLIGQGLKFPILVTTNAFQIEQDYFLSSIVDHEYVHTEDLYRGFVINGKLVGRESIRKLNDVILGTFMELRAYANQFLRFDERDISLEDRRNLFITASGYIEEIPEITCGKTEEKIVRAMRRNARSIRIEAESL